ncbi:hypothetical protein OK074_4232 [Actinobacteria bacterium OK074]|nr:hypothetical protein OK074_4232 [Actinobacteria bacterium OK074]
MTTSMRPALVGRLAALAAATVLLVLGTSAPASAQCAAPTYHGGLPVRVGACPEGVAGGASGGVWAVVVLAVGLWIAYARSRSGATTEADLGVIDAVFGAAAEATAAEATAAEAAADEAEEGTPYEHPPHPGATEPEPTEPGPTAPGPPESGPQGTPPGTP